MRRFRSPSSLILVCSALYLAGPGLLADEPMRLVRDINASVFPGDPPRTASSAPFFLVGVEGRLFFAAFTFDKGRELWMSDGTEAGTPLVKDIRPGSGSSSPKDLFELNGALIFTASEGGPGSREWWRSDGTEEGTTLIKDIRPGPLGSMREGDFMSSSGVIELNGALFFQADDGVHGGELWKTDGTEAGTALVIDINPGPAGAFPIGFVRVGSTLFFLAREDDHGGELWQSDGTEAGTRLVKDIIPGPSDSINNMFLGVDGVLYFSAEDGAHGVELWRSDGTEAGTLLVKDILPGPDGSFPRAAAEVNGLFVFAADDGSHGVEPWISDGTEDGTVLVKDIYPGPERSVRSSRPLVAGGNAFMSVFDEEHGVELWKSDGTEEGTVLVKDIIPGLGEASPSLITVVHGTPLFTAQDDDHGSGLWRTDGTEEGTVRVQGLFDPAGPPDSGQSAIVGSRFFLSASDITHGMELWVGRAAILTGRPVQAVQDLAGDVRALGLPFGVEVSLTAKLDAAAEALGRPGGSRMAQRILSAFGSAVEAHTPGLISDEDAAALLEFQAEIEALLDAGAQHILHQPRRPFVERPSAVEKSNLR